MHWAWLTVGKMSLRLRLAIILIALLASVFADSIFYAISVMMDAVCVGVVVWAGWPIVKKLLAEK